MAGLTMEQKKLLWIIFSTTFFLLIVVGIGLIWMYPGARNEPAVAGTEAGSREAGADFDPVEWVRSDNQSPGIVLEPTEPEGDSFVVVYGDPGEGAEEILKTQPEVLQEESRAAPVRTAPPAAVQPAPSRAVKSTTVRAENPEPASRTVGVTEYWIQTGSYTSRSRADLIKKELDELGLNGRILSKDINGTQYYRVRVGPYEDKAEADKFLAWVKDREQFQQSYISQVYRKKTVVQ
jgi:DedD protein